jgi:hypothetical protein
MSGQDIIQQPMSPEELYQRLTDACTPSAGHETEKLFRNTENIFAKCLKTMREKNHDYSGDNADDPMRNFNISAQVVGITPEQGILVRMVDKINRLGTAFSGAELKVKDETIEDTLGDLINYSAIVAFRHSQRSETK